jgi:2-polyprenyl-3-methyl-5-hydroxy-6-metoxy-1,4-benzoquinol methylase
MTAPPERARTGRGTNTAATGRQELVDSHFASESARWTDMYARSDLHSLIHQERLALALAAVDRLGPAAGAPVLDLGCGAGVLTVALAQRGFAVEAADTVPEMLDSTRRNAERAGVSAVVRTSLADAHALAFEPGHFELVVALGVLPWLEDPAAALREIARVLRPGGHAIITADNQARLAYFVDPMRNPALAGFRRALKARAARAGLIHSRPQPSQFWAREVLGIAAAAGLQVVERRTFGFGVFTLLGVRVLPDRLGVRLHRSLQRLATRGVPGIRAMGAQHFVVARRSALSDA